MGGRRVAIVSDAAGYVGPNLARRLAAADHDLVVGDPMDGHTQVGPVALESGLQECLEFIDDARSHGAEIRTGGERVGEQGWFLAPTVVAGVTRDMRMYLEEVFGPVAGVFKVASLDEGIEVANATTFGLGSNAWTSDPAEQARCAAELEAGAVFINGMVTSYPELPFGGIKASGYGRELAALGIRAFCNAKTVWVG